MGPFSTQKNVREKFSKQSWKFTALNPKKHVTTDVILSNFRIPWPPWYFGDVWYLGFGEFFLLTTRNGPFRWTPGMKRPKKTYHARGGFAAARGWNVPRIIRRGPQLEQLWKVFVPRWFGEIDGKGHGWFVFVCFFLKVSYSFLFSGEFVNIVNGT